MRDMYPCDYGDDNCDLILPSYATYRDHLREFHWDRYHLQKDETGLPTFLARPAHALQHAAS